MQLDVSDDGFLSLMSDDGGEKNDVKIPDGEVGDKIKKLFREEEKESSKFALRASSDFPWLTLSAQTSSSSPLWERRLPSIARKPPRVPKRPRRADLVKHVPFLPTLLELKAFGRASTTAGVTGTDTVQGHGSRQR